MLKRLKHWFLWAKRGTILDSRTARIDRGMESGRKLDSLIKINKAECEDAIMWQLYLTGGAGYNIDSMIERWEKYQRAELLPPGDWLQHIRAIMDQ